MGSVIGKGGSKIKEIQEASGARLNASEGMLPGSTERVLSVTGVADAIHIATYYVGNILIEAGPPPHTSAASTYRPTARSRYPPPPPHYPPYSSHHPYSGGSSSYSSYPPPGPPPTAGPPTTQQIYIPNDLVGCIIGKGGSKINEIRSISGSQIRIMEPGATAPGAPPGAAASNERLVTVTGQPAQIQTAVQLLYHVCRSSVSFATRAHSHARSTSASRARKAEATFERATSSDLRTWLVDNVSSLLLYLASFLICFGHVSSLCFPFQHRYSKIVHIAPILSFALLNASYM